MGTLKRELKQERAMASSLVSWMLVCSLAVSPAWCLVCWHTSSDSTAAAEYTSLRNSMVPVVEKTCSDTEVSCSREWYTVGKVSDVFYKLGCSTMAAKAEVSTAKGSGTSSMLYCDSDYCNPAHLTKPVLTLLILLLSFTIFI